MEIFSKVSQWLDNPPCDQPPSWPVGKIEDPGSRSRPSIEDWNKFRGTLSRKLGLQTEATLICRFRANACSLCLCTNILMGGYVVLYLCRLASRVGHVNWTANPPWICPRPPAAAAKVEAPSSRRRSDCKASARESSQLTRGWANKSI